MNVIENNLIAIKQSINLFEERYGRQSGSVQLLAASKGQPAEKILTAINAGQRAFGENYLQEALTKISAINDPSVDWHFIGSIQSNKTKKIAEHFSWVQSVADKNIAQRLNDQRPEHLPPLNICIEVNISAERAKSGVMADELLWLLDFCNTLPRIKLRGLMAIPAIQSDFDAQRKIFHKLLSLLHSLREQGYNLDTLSMGMSDDYEAAIAEGSTMVRIGTAIFGHRVKPNNCP